MAFRRRVLGRRRRPVYWDSFNATQASLPGALLLDENASTDAGFSGLRRYDGVGDRTIVRTIMDFTGLVNQLDFQVSENAVLEVCVGIGIWDSSQDLNGQGLNTAMAVGTGPQDDASNSRWMVRCCIQIPIGMMAQYGTTENIVVKPTPDSWYLMSGGTAATQAILFGCHVDTKVKRKLHGTQTPWINVAMQTTVQPTPAVGDDIVTNLNALNVRWLLQNSA